MKKLGILAVLLVLAIVIGTMLLRKPSETEINEIVQEVRGMFPDLSRESAEKFARKVADLNLTDEEVLTWASELAAKGEIFLSNRQKEEMTSLWWKAVGKLPLEQQTFVQSRATKMRFGQQLTLEEQELISEYVGRGISLLNQADKARYHYLRGKALEAALQRE